MAPVNDPSPPAGLAGSRIVLGVSGGIAAYKAVELARLLTEAGAEVRVVMTRAATELVGPITFSTLTGRPVATDLFPDPAPPDIPHTALARWADVVVVAPATANVIARCALGIADDILSALLLATRAPVVLAPAMHTEMWEHEATVRNAETLRGRGVRLVGPESGRLAGPETGVGRLAELPALIAAISGALGRRGDLVGRRVVVSAGGTQEPLDPVRFIGNRSSGRMGYEIAAEALRRGAKVILVSGPTHLDPPRGAEQIRVETAAEMRGAMLQAAEGADVVIMAAAVADWRPTRASAAKIKKAAGPPRVELEPTEDILAELAARRVPGQVLVGFSAETEDVEERSKGKLSSKGIDLIVGNLVGTSDSGFEVDSTRAVILDAAGTLDLGLTTKRELAARLLDLVATRLAP
ncbi:MAG: bifunctional phosphopantothenoylcysteine decarboxylase/phosphopantothenate--cysteine ligase CoaBC [Actinomycetota bacterium]